jgi:peptidoglycan hydrolase CwlO-like protein
LFFRTADTSEFQVQIDLRTVHSIEDFRREWKEQQYQKRNQDELKERIESKKKKIEELFEEIKSLQKEITYDEMELLVCCEK